MAAQFAALALHGIDPVIQNYDTIYEKSREKVKKIRIPGKNGQRDEIVEYKSMDEGGYRSPRAGNRETPRRGQGYGYSADTHQSPRSGRPKSADRGSGHDGAGRSRQRDYTPKSARRYESPSDSEGSIPPRDRRRRNTVGQQDRNAAVTGAAAGAGAYGAARAYDGRDNRDDRVAKYNQPQDHGRDDRPRDKSNEKKKDDSSNSSSDDSSSIVSSSEDEKDHKHIRTKELITAGLAAVATVHAASGVYSSMEARDKRYEQLKSGKISPEEARKEKTKAMLQDFAAVGVAALSIKGAMSKWQGAAAQHKHRKEHKKEKAERHQKRLEKRNSQKSKSEKSSDVGVPASAGQYSRPPNPRAAPARPGYNRAYSTSEPDLTRRNYDNYKSGPMRYQDGNPYSPYGYSRR